MLAAVALLAVTIVPWTKLGSEFMPPLREGDILFMPTTLPGISVTEARRTLQVQDRLLMQFPEVKVALGKIGRSSTPTDPAPLAMVETHASLRPEEDWPKRLIEKGYLEQLATQMTQRLKQSDLLTDSGKELETKTLAEQAEGMTRAEINQQIRLELVEALHSGLKKLRAGLKEHREQAVANGEPVGSLFAEEELEDEWARDLLLQQVERIRPHLPQRIVERTTTNLVDIIQSQGGITESDIPAAVEMLREQWQDEIEPSDVPLGRTTFAELTKDEMHKAITVPGMPNWWLMPIETRIGMLTTGMRGLLGLKVYGTDLEQLEKVGLQLETVLKEVPGTVSVVAERPMGGNYLDIVVDRDACARYGLKVGDVQRLVETAIGGINIDMTVEGRYRFPISVRYPRELRDDPEKLERILIAAPRGRARAMDVAPASAQMTDTGMTMTSAMNSMKSSGTRLIPLGQVANIEITDGPPRIKSESGMLLTNIPVDIEEGIDIGTYVKNAQAAIDKARSDGRLEIPPGTHMKWSGQFEFMEEVRQRLNIIIPITLALIFVLIYFNMKNIAETLITMFTLPFALIGGVWGMYFLDYNWSIAVAIGFIALAGLAAETGIIMHVYLDLAYKKHRREKGRALTPKELYEAVIEGAVLRVRPKLMTVLTDFIALMPILWATTPGAGPMKRIAVPVIFGVITSAVHTLVLIPVYYTLYKRYEQWKEGAHAHSEADLEVATRD